MILKYQNPNFIHCAMENSPGNACQRTMLYGFVFNDQLII